MPLETAQVCADVLEVAEESAPILNPAVISDVLVGALLAEAGLESAALNVEVNLAAMTDQSAVERFSKDLPVLKRRRSALGCAVDAKTWFHPLDGRETMLEAAAPVSIRKSNWPK